MDGFLLGIDIGTSACKIAVFTKYGEPAAMDSAEYPVYYPHTGWAEQDPDDWWTAVCRMIPRVLREGRIAPEEIRGIGIDGQSWSAVAVDRSGNVLANTPIWMDTRAKDLCEEMNEKIGADRIFEVCGNPLQPTYTTPKVLWYQRYLPAVYRNTYKILQSNSYIAYKLTGVMSQDLSQGYGWHCFDMKKGEWNIGLCEEFGLSPYLLPEIYPCHAVIGTVTQKAARECGLAEGTPVAAGGLDAACGTLGAGVLYPGETQEQGGQAGGMSICTDLCRADRRLILSFHVVPDRWLLQGGTTGGGGVMRWLEAEFGAYERAEGRRQGKSSLDLFNEEASTVPPGSDGLVFLPYMAGERTPIWDTDAKGVWYGIDFGKTKGHFIRSAMEGCAYALKHNLDAAEEAGAHVDVLHAVGGSANSLLWTQIKSDVTGKPVVVPASDTATTMGAALLAGVGVGMYRDFDEAVRLTVEERRRHEPNPNNRKAYERGYRTYLDLYSQLKGIMKREGEYSREGSSGMCE